MLHPVTYLSIDPGTTGALAFVNGDDVTVFDIPTFKEAKPDGGERTRVDLPALVALIQALAFVNPGIVAVIEEVGGRKGDQAFTTGILMFVAGALAAACAAAGLAPRYVPPQTWTAWFKRQGMRLQSSAAKKRKKKSGVQPVASIGEASRDVAARLYPGAASSLKRAKDHNRADAILIGHWARCNGIM